jgi:multicomponent Na+:H+ antiporter subunit E
MINVNNVNGLLWNILLALAWTAVTGTFTIANLVLGFFIGFGILFLVRSIAGIPNYFIEVRQVLGLLAYLLWELMLANLRVAWDVITPTFHMRPGIIAVPLDAETDAEITLLGNMITLTPGSMTMDVSSDRKVLYVHAMYVDEPETVTDDVKQGFERRLLDILR